MLSIRMRRMGSSKKPFFRVVVQEARSARDSSFVENLGTYSPRSKPAQVEINKERLAHWLSKGARPSDSVRTLIAKHLTKDLSAVVPAPGDMGKIIGRQGRTAAALRTLVSLTAEQQGTRAQLDIRD
jgi:small subunit ribosomal protein S16